MCTYVHRVSRDNAIAFEKVAKFPHVPLRRRGRSAKISSRADECVALLPSSWISRFLPNSWRRDRSSSIHFRGSNYFHAVLSRRRKLRVIEITGNRCTASSFHASAHTTHRQQRFLFTDTKYLSQVIYFLREIYFPIQFFLAF